MTVRELIAELSKHDPEMIAVVQLDSNELGNGKTVGKVSIADAYSVDPYSDGGKVYIRDQFPECQGEWTHDFDYGPFYKVVNINS